jgi:hypothetical protein
MTGINPLWGANVYFQPPESKKMDYPCIVYRRNDIKTNFADDISYSSTKQYQITVIDANPDSLIPDKIEKLSKCAFDRHFTKDNLNHDIYNLYF